MKRAFDLLVALILIAATSPLLLSAAVAVRGSSRGPVVFRQVRVGRGGELFVIFKFRTMYDGAQGQEVTQTGDARITPIGHWLRKSKLDELPQLWNVVRGEMSLVGPRPEVPRYVNEWPLTVRQVVLSVRPGITDPASIMFRNENDLLASAEDPVSEYLEVIMPRKLSMYENYVQRRTFIGDVKILLSTVRQVARG